MTISIIIPIYNGEHFIEQCINSIEKNNFSSTEIICINDGSTDDSLKRLLKLKKQFDNLIIINQKNKGIAAARNKGIELSRGKYIFFIDQDDYIDDDYIQTFYQKIIDLKADVIIGGYKRVNNKGKIIYKMLPKIGKLGSLLIISPWAKIYRKDFIDKNKIRFLNHSIGEDVFLTC